MNSDSSSAIGPTELDAQLWLTSGQSETLEEAATANNHQLTTND